MRRRRILWGVTALTIAASAYWYLSPASTPPIKEDRDVLPGSIARLEGIELGGMEQYVLIRGHDNEAPVLLWLHGGPGAAQIPIARHFNGILEEDFIVVQWDQRGAGKSNPRGFDERTMTFEQFVSDAHELTQYLKERFEKDKIYLVGHSWGTQLGIKVVQRHPEDYHAFIAVSQAVDSSRGTQVAHEWLRHQMENRGNKGDLAKLDELGDPPYVDHGDYVAFAKMIEAYGGGLDVSLTQLAWIALRSPEYGLGDYLAWLKGATRGSGLMWEETPVV